MPDRTTRPPTIHILGASGGGCSTLGRALSSALGAAFLDTDDFYWLPTNPPFAHKRATEDRLQMLQRSFADAADRGWVLSGSLNGWGDPLIPLFGMVIFVATPTEVRIQRLRERERARFGAAIEPGGSQHDVHVAFLDWASRYEEGTRVSRNRASHELWLTALPCPFIRVNGTLPVEELVGEVLRYLPLTDPSA